MPVLFKPKSGKTPIFGKAFDKGRGNVTIDRPIFFREPDIFLFYLSNCKEAGRI